MFLNLVCIKLDVDDMFKGLEKRKGTVSLYSISELLNGTSVNSGRLSLSVKKIKQLEAVEEQVQVTAAQVSASTSKPEEEVHPTTSKEKPESPVLPAHIEQPELQAQSSKQEEEQPVSPATTPKVQPRKKKSTKRSK